MFLNREQHYGNIEYKRSFVKMIDSKISKYATQLRFRITEGNGTAIYLVGVCDNGQIIGVPAGKESEATCVIMKSITQEIESYIYTVRTIPISDTMNMICFVIKNHFDLNSLGILLG